MIGLLRLLREHPEAVEADLARWYHVDYRDRWRFDEHGRRRLTLRMIAVRLRHLPPDAAVVRAVDDQPAWNLEHVLLADIWQAVAALAGAKHRQHPLLAKALRHSRARPKPQTPQRRRALDQARRRARARRRAIEAGEIT